MMKLLVSILSVVFLLPLYSCGGGGGGGTESFPSGTFPTNTNVVYLHHSTGGVIWGGGVPEGVAEYNSANGKSYTISEYYYPDDPYPWANYPYDYWHLWVEDGGQAPAVNVSTQTIEYFTLNYKVIVFKHCYPVSGITDDSGTADINSETKSIENYKLQYNALKARLRQFPDNRFIVWTGAALLESESSVEEGARARDFFTWVKNEWDEQGDNIFVWDFYELETEGGNFLLPAYSAGDSHPNDTFASTVAPYFVNRLVDVIEGRGDTGSITGE